MEIKKIRKRLNLTQQDFADALNVSKSLVQKWESNERFPDEIAIENIHKITQNNTDLDIKPLFVNKKLPEITKTKDAGRPFYDVDFTLGFEGVDNDITLHPEFNIDFPPANKETVNWFRGKGNSMIGEINSGDYIALEEIEDFSWFPLGRIYGIVTKNGFRTIKRVVKSTNADEYLLVSSNPDKVNYPDQTIPKNMLHKLFKVVFVIKDLDE